MTELIELYPCSCDCSGLALDVWDDEDDQAFISLWRNGRGRAPSWKSRIRHAWYCLRHGHPYTDDVILSRETAIKLGTDLLHRCRERTE